MSKKFNSFQALVYSTNPDALPEDKKESIETPQPENQTLKVFLDSKGRRGKTVTIIDNFVGNDEDLNALGKKLKTKCGAGGSVKEGQIIIQGDYRIKIMEWLRDWGYKVK